jgi:hypothetical protein
MTAPRSTPDVIGGGDVDPVGVSHNGRSLSVAEIQQALRDLQARGPRRAAAELDAPSQRPENGSPQRPALGSERPPTARRPRRASAGTPARGWGDPEGETTTRRGDNTSGTGRVVGDTGELRAGWIAVVAAHAGAGASTVALAISDAAAADGRRVHLIDRAHPSRSGLVAAASEELGTDVTGAWRRGLRSGVTIDRRATDVIPGDWPTDPAGESPGTSVVDLGVPAPDRLICRAANRVCVVIVCRPTVPGVRLTEQLLNQLARQPVVVAAVGPSRWPGEVIASLGPRLRALRAAGRVIAVPTDRRLEVTGLTSSPLPKPVRSAGRSLLERIDDGHPGGAARSSAAITDPARTPEETRR